MTRTARFKLFYVMQLVVLAAAVGTLLLAAPREHRALALIVLTALLFVPGRIQGIIFRHHFRGRRLADQGRFEESIRESEAFLGLVQRQRWRKRAIWLAGVVYSRDIEAITWNNVGFAALQLGEIEKAEISSLRALDLDAEYPLPHAILALIASTRGDEHEAHRHAAEAFRLGYRGTLFDALTRRVQQILASVEGHVDSRKK